MKFCNARFESYARNLVWLVNAGVDLKTNLVRELRQPLLQTERPGRFKLYQSDVGMLMARYHVSVAHDNDILAAPTHPKCPNTPTPSLRRQGLFAG